MATSVQKITLSPSRDIPFNKLLLSQANVRRVKAGISVEELAEDIARRGLLSGLSVRAVTGTDGQPTGMYEIPAGGRRFRALDLLVKAKRLARTAPVPCIVREDGMAEEDSLAENLQRAPLHPLDQFRAFQTLREKGESEEEIAAHFFVPVAIVKQRLKLAGVSPKLLDIYAEDGMTLDQLMAFTVSPDHERQETVFERIAQGYEKQPHVIKRLLTEGAIRASDKRALFIGVDAYVEAGGGVMRDLFQSDEGGWLQDTALVELMVAEKLREELDKVRAEGWKWIDVATDFGYGHSYGLRQLFGTVVDPSPQEQATRDALQAELDGIEAEYADGGDLPEEVDARLGEIETAIEALDNRPMAFDPAEVTRAGAFISIDGAGQARIERGFVRPEDELPVEQPVVEGITDAGEQGGGADSPAGPDSDPVDPAVEAEEEDGIRPLSDRLMTELTAHRTLGLRANLADRPETAFVVALHAIVLQTFYAYPADSCADLAIKSVGFGRDVPGLVDCLAAQALDALKEKLRALLPKEPGELWDTLFDIGDGNRQLLFAYCIATCVNATVDPYNRRPRAIVHAEQLAQEVQLDMVAWGWTPTVENYLGRVTKARIGAAVEEARGSEAAGRLTAMKKPEMASAAETLLGGTGWLPEPLRTLGAEQAAWQAAAGDDDVNAEPPVGDAENGEAVAAADLSTDALEEETAASDGVVELARNPNEVEAEAPTEAMASEKHGYEERFAIAAE